MSQNDLVKIFHALSDGTRLALFEKIVKRAKYFNSEDDLLYKGNCAKYLQSKHRPNKLSQATISHHLQILEEANLILGKRYGKWIHFFPSLEIIDMLGSYFKDLAQSLIQDLVVIKTIPTDQNKTFAKDDFDKLLSLLANHEIQTIHQSKRKIVHVAYLSSQDVDYHLIFNPSTQLITIKGYKFAPDNDEQLSELIIKYISTLN